MRHDNAKTLREGFKKAQAAIEGYMQEKMVESAIKLLLEVAKQREFQGFTGNTQTSYTCGIYFDGRLIKGGIIHQGVWTERPRRKKVQFGEYAYLKRPYEGRPRGVRGMVDITSDRWGQHTAEDFLKEHKAPRGSLALVMTTGTEYSEYIEEVHGLDVLTGTYLQAMKILSSTFKTMPSSYTRFEWE